MSTVFNTESQHLILLAHSDAQLLEHMGTLLHDHAGLLFAMDTETVLHHAQTHSIDVLVISDTTPHMTILDLCSQLKTIPSSADAIVLVVTENPTSEYAAQMLQAGVADLILQPLRPPLLKTQLQTQLSIKYQADLLRSHDSIDSLTKMANLEAFYRMLVREWQRGYRQGSPIALLIIEIEQFTLFARHYGQEQADQCLITIAGALAKTVQRPADLLARYGPHRFAILLPETSTQGASLLAERAYTTIEGLHIQHAVSATSAFITANIGVADMQPSSIGRSGQDKLVKAAEEALHIVKLAKLSNG